MRDVVRGTLYLKAFLSMRIVLLLLVFLSSFVRCADDEWWGTLTVHVSNGRYYDHPSIQGAEVTFTTSRENLNTQTLTTDSNGNVTYMAWSYPGSSTILIRVLRVSASGNIDHTAEFSRTLSHHDDHQFAHVLLD